MKNSFACRIGCGACCIAPSISSAIPGMPDGKPAGVRCVQLTSRNECRLFGKAERPLVCLRFSATAEICGTDYDIALKNLTELEIQTRET
jgi:Fe-S-cluster containining protein